MSKIPHPKETPLEQWPQGWLVLECSSLLDEPLFIVMHDHEKREKGFHITPEEMRIFIGDRRD